MDRDQLIRDALKSVFAGEIGYNEISSSDLFSRVEKVFIIQKYKEHLDLKISGAIDPIDKHNAEIFTWGAKTANRVFSPIEAQKFIIVAGMSGSGKTEFTFDLAIKNACEILGKVLYISLEMPTEDIYTRRALVFAGITKDQWRDKRLINGQQKAMYRYKKTELKSIPNFMPFGFDDDTGGTLENIFELIEKEKPSLVFLDNFNLIYDANHLRPLEKDEVHSHRIMNFCKASGVPMIVVHHFNKDGEIRGSQKIFDNASAVFACKRNIPDGDSQFTDAELAEFTVVERKDRLMGRPGIFTYYFSAGTFLEEYGKPDPFVHTEPLF